MSNPQVCRHQMPVLWEVWAELLPSVGSLLVEEADDSGLSFAHIRMNKTEDNGPVSDLVLVSS